ncbi:MAG: hypothetical protein Q7S73_03150 [bacterium]|nr:hypothetical protein [bacterium]
MLSFIYSREKYTLVLLSVAIGILISAPAIYFRYFDGGYKGIDFFGSDAENYYLGQIQEIYDGHWFSGNIYVEEGKNDPYVQQPLPAMIIAFLGQSLGISARDVNVLTKFLFPALLTVIVYLFFSALTGRKDFAILMTIFVMLIQASWIFFDPGSWLPFLLKGEFRGTDYNFISYARPINPQISSIFFFGYLLCAWKFFFSRLSEKMEKIYGIASAVILGLSFYIYFFTFSFLSVFNAVLFFWFLYSRDWIRLKKTFLVSIGALAIAVPYFANVLEMMKSPNYSQLAHRTNILETHRFIFSKVWWGVTALFLLLYRGSRKVKIFTLAFLATAFLVTNQQLITGKTLPLPAHYHWYYIAPIGGAILVYLFFMYFEKLAGLFVSRLAMLFFILISFYAGFLYQKISYTKQWDYFIYQQRYAPILSWLDLDIKKESAIFTNEDLSGLIPAYTRHNVYYSGLLTDSLISEERIRHSLYVYFFLNGVTEDSARDFFYDNRDWVGSQIFSDYYRQKSGCHGCFPDSILDGFIQEYRKFLKKGFLEQIKKYQVDYAVWDKEKNPEWRLDRFFNEKVYEKDNIIVYKF